MNSIRIRQHSHRRRSISWFSRLCCVALIHHAAAFSTTATCRKRKLPNSQLGMCIPSIPINKPYLAPFSSILRPFSNILRSEASSSSSINEDFDYSQERNVSKLVLEAETLRAKAKEIMAQALAMEKELQQSRSKERKSKVQESDELIEEWFCAETNVAISQDNQSAGKDLSVAFNLANFTTVADRLEKQKASTDQVLMVAERLFELQMEASGQTAFLRYGAISSSTNQSATAVKSTSKSEVSKNHNETEYERLSGMMDALARAVAFVDEKISNSTATTGTFANPRWTGRVEYALQARLNELRRTQKVNLDRKLAAEISKAAKSAKASVGEFVRRNLVGKMSDGSNMTAVNDNITINDVVEEKMELMPLWVPPAFLPFIIASTSSAFGQEEVAALNEKVFLGSQFFVTSHSSVPGAAIFRGNIRDLVPSKQVNESDDPAERPTATVFQQIEKRLGRIPHLRDKVQLFLLPDPEWRPKNEEQEPEPRPVVLALPRALSPDESKIDRGAIVKEIKSLMLPLAVITTMRYAIEGFSLNRLFFDAVVRQRRIGPLLQSCFPVVGGIVGMHLLQEVVHYLVAKRRKIKIGRPVPIPSFALGTFGCITPIRSFPEDRSSLLDFALSGPFATSIASIGCIFASVLLTVRASPEALASFPVLPAVVMKSSFLAGTITSWVASKIMLLPAAQPVPIHPLYLVGYSGLIASGLNLLPIFRLDGGRACAAAMGQRQGAVISVSTLLFLLSMALSGGSGLGFSWGMFVALFQRQPEIPARDDVTEVDNIRLGAWMFSFLLSISILMPFPGSSNGIL